MAKASCDQQRKGRLFEQCASLHCRPLTCFERVQAAEAIWCLTEGVLNAAGPSCVELEKLLDAAIGQVTGQWDRTETATWAATLDRAPLFLPLLCDLQTLSDLHVLEKETSKQERVAKLGSRAASRCTRTLNRQEDNALCSCPKKAGSGLAWICRAE